MEYQFGLTDVSLLNLFFILMLKYFKISDTTSEA
jgi:hypothetical protein